MAELTKERLMQLRASARANQKDAMEESRRAEKKAIELISHYSGAIQTLTLLIDDMEAQEMAEIAELEYQRIEASGESGEVDASPRSGYTIEDLQKVMPPGVTISGVNIAAEDDEETE